MSSWNKAAKVNQKTHRERHQPEARKHLGLLEKHSDYKKRAEDFQKKKQTIALLKKRAQNRNPDEFYYHMINSKVEDGMHREKAPEEDTPEQKKLMKSQDLKYITYKRVIEMKKIQKLQAQLHLLDVSNATKNKHIFFTDNDEEKKNFDLAKHLDTVPELLDCKINRPRISDLAKRNVQEISQESIKYKEEMYKELEKRILREKELAVIQEKLELRKHLQDKKSKKPTRISGGSKNAAAKYLWSYERKK